MFYFSAKRTFLYIDTLLSTHTYSCTYVFQRMLVTFFIVYIYMYICKKASEDRIDLVKLTVM